MFCNQRFYFCQIDLEVFSVCGNDDQVTSVFFYEGTIFREERGYSHDFGLFISKERFYGGNQSGSRTAGDEQVCGLDIGTEALVQIFGDGFSCPVKTAGHGIAVNGYGIHIAQDIFDRLINLCRSRNARIAECVVEDIFRADNLCLLQSVGEQFTNNRRLVAQFKHCFVVHK